MGRHYPKALSMRQTGGAPPSCAPEHNADLDAVSADMPPSSVITRDDAMYRYPPAFGCLLAAAALASGCLRVDQHLTLNADGSGHLEARYSVREEQLAGIRAAAERSGDQPGVPAVTNPAALLRFSEEQIRSAFKDNAARGIRLDQVALSASNGWQSVEVDVHFRDLATLAQSELLGDASMSLTKSPAGTWVLEQAPILRHQVAGDLANDHAALDGAMAALLRDVRARVRITVPGDILSTTADRHALRTAAWTIEPGSDAKAWQRARGEALRVEFSGSGLTLEAQPPAADSGTSSGGT